MVVGTTKAMVMARLGSHLMVVRDTLNRHIPPMQVHRQCKAIRHNSRHTLTMVALNNHLTYPTISLNQL